MVAGGLAINRPGLAPANQLCSHQFEVVGVGHFAHKLAPVLAIFLFLLFPLFTGAFATLAAAGFSRETPTETAATPKTTATTKIVLAATFLGLELRAERCPFGCRGATKMPSFTDR
jgi:hypothetical protein